MQSFIIHMSSSLARRPNAERLVQELPQARLIEAVDGRDPAQITGIATRHGTMHQPHYPFPLSPGEIGCFLSHRKCWQMIANGAAAYALIAEDDLDIDPAVWPDVLALIEQYADQNSYFRIPAKNRERPARILARQNASTLFLPRTIGLQTVCQVVGRATAFRLLAATRVIDRPVDTFLQMHWVTGQPVHTILPNGVSELTAQTGGSTIQKKTRTSEKLMREFKRGLYRARTRSRPQRG